MASYGNNNKKSSFKKSGGFEKKSYGNKSYTKKNNNDGDGGKSGFVGIGSITPSKSENGNELVEALKDSGTKMWWKVFLPKGVNQVTLQRGDRVLISFKTYENDPDFVLGHVSLPPEEENAE